MLRSLIKVPMVMLMGFSGLVVGLSLTCVKFVGEIVANVGFSEEPLLIIVFLGIAALDSLFLLYSVNLAMKFYDQIDVMPTYFAQILIWSVFCGMVLLDEHSYYTTENIVVIAFSSFICFIGI